MYIWGIIWLFFSLFYGSGGRCGGYVYVYTEYGEVHQM